MISLHSSIGYRKSSLRCNYRNENSQSTFYQKEDLPAWDGGFYLENPVIMGSPSVSKLRYNLCGGIPVAQKAAECARDGGT